MCNRESKQELSHCLPLWCRDLRLHAVEFFAGKAVITGAFLKNRCTCVAYDICLDKELMNFIGSVGYLFALRCCLSVLPGALVHFAPVCSSWVWMCRSGSGRSTWNPAGDSRRAFVRDGNLMASRVCLLIELLQAKRCAWLLEQPKGSLFEEHARFRDIVKNHSVHKVTVSLGRFGARTSKPTWLYSPDQQLLDVIVAKQGTPKVYKRKLVTSKCVRGKVSVTGRKQVLKQSQHYPAAFGRALYAAWVTRKEHWQKFACDLEVAPVRPVRKSEFLRKPEDPWEDAALPEM